MVGLYKLPDRVIVVVAVIISMIMIISLVSHARPLYCFLHKNGPAMEEFQVQSRFNKRFESASSIAEEVVIGRYKSTLLNFLPKGPVPPSAPSGKIHNYD
ncbi:hypothetical protein Ddye_014997 [Dipteronia dyeriana]|uniref:Uncharacterized protein n=1 Tax=Dipteronia dyeriana TaxID=168575 RepID=A0AAD9WYS0_9ROSI|nr:hypothetical protein Ddye_014997 [Dipteronia dyeriana]